MNSPFRFFTHAGIAVAAALLLGCTSSNAVLPSAAASGTDQKRPTPVKLASSPPDTATPARTAFAMTLPLPAGVKLKYEGNFLLAGQPVPFTATVTVDDALETAKRRAEAIVAEWSFVENRKENFVVVRDESKIGFVPNASLMLILDQPDGWERLANFYDYSGRLVWFLPAQLSVGTSWPIGTHVGIGNAEVVAIETITVKFGTYKDAFRIRYTNQQANQDVTVWLDPKVGVVKMDLTGETWANGSWNQPLKGSLELIDMRLN